MQRAGDSGTHKSCVTPPVAANSYRFVIPTTYLRGTAPGSQTWGDSFPPSADFSRCRAFPLPFALLAPHAARYPE